MNSHERAFVESFVASDRRDRYIAALANPKKRVAFNRQLDHPKVGFLVPKYIEQIVPSEQNGKLLGPKLRSMGAPELCWVFGNLIDGQQMGLCEALATVVGARSGTIVSCLPGRLAFFESEDGRVILRRP